MTLNKNQKLVLEYLEHDSEVTNTYPSNSICKCSLTYRLNGLYPKEVFQAFCKLSKTEEFEVLVKFGEWGLEREN